MRRTIMDIADAIDIPEQQCDGFTITEIDKTLPPQPVSATTKHTDDSVYANAYNIASAFMNKRQERQHKERLKHERRVVTVSPLMAKLLGKI